MVSHKNVIGVLKKYRIEELKRPFLKMIGTRTMNEGIQSVLEKL